MPRFLAIVTIASLCAMASAKWTPPIGIPVPPFGIEETVLDYYPPGYYTYYIDNTSPNATDTNNAYGSPAKPRMTLPVTTLRADFPAGTVIAIAAGTYTCPAPWNESRLKCRGTPTQPVFIRGLDPNNRPKFIKNITLDTPSSYTIVENIDFDGATSTTGAGIVVWGASDHIGIRNCVCQNGIGCFCVEPAEDCHISDVVFYKNLVHHKGDYLAEYDQDNHGFAITVWSAERGSVDRVWVVDNVMHHNSGNGIQINGHTEAKRLQLQHIYVGRNLAYSNKQSGFWVKQAEHVIFSQNIAHSALTSGSCIGDGMGCQYGGGHVWFLFNKMWGTPFGIRMADCYDGQGTNEYAIGNVIFNVHSRQPSIYSSTDPGAQGRGIHVWSGSLYLDTHFINNTIYDVDSGIGIQQPRPVYDIANNLIDAVVDPTGYHVALCRDDSAANTNLYNCFFGSNPVSARIRWGYGWNGYSIAQMQSTFGEARNCIGGQADFANVPSFCRCVPFMETTQQNVALDETFYDGATRSTLTGAVDFGAMGVVPGARVRITAGSNTISQKSNGYLVDLKVIAISGHTLTMYSDFTNAPSSDIKFYMHYYPATQTDFYVKDTTGFQSGDIVEYDNDGVARTVESVTTDSIGPKVVVSAASGVVGGILPGATLADWKANTNVEEDFHLRGSSPAIDAGADLTAIYDLYYSLYGERIDVDFDGKPRTQGAAADIGAFETSGPANQCMFYKGSAYDAVSDDAAVATDKTPLLPGHTATFANYTSYVHGITGMMIDLPNVCEDLSAADFEFHVGNDSNPAAWQTLATAPTVTVREDAGSGGYDRVVLTWPDNTIVGEWLQVKVLANAVTGLANPDVFYFGSAPGDTGNATSDAQITPADEIAVRNGTHTAAENPATITDACDFDRDGRVGPSDAVITRNSGTNSQTALQLITPPRS